MSRSSLLATDEGELIARAGQGNREAFGQLYEQYVLRIFRHIYHLVDDSQLAEDLTTQTFLKALAAIPRYQLRGVPFLAWLLRIAYNLTMNQEGSEEQRYRPAAGNDGSHRDRVFPRRVL